ncbi:MAG TPA: hypothetical protein VIV66_20255 [Pyrinomonadaceae bacterium]
MKEPANTLIQVLIAKCLVESVLVGAVAVSFFALAFPPSFRGWGEATPQSIAGWVVNDSAPWERVEVQLFIDNAFIGNVIADKSRPDVVAAGWAKDEWHGFEFPLPVIPQGDHEARAYAVHVLVGDNKRTLQIIGDPIRFRRNPDGSLVDLKLRAN